MKKLNRKSASPPPSPLRRPTPATYFHPTFLIFQIPSCGGGNWNVLPPVKKGGGPNYVIYITQMVSWKLKTTSICLSKLSYLMNLYQHFLNILNDLITYIIIQHDKQPITLSKFITWVPSLTNTIQSEINQLLHKILL